MSLESFILLLFCLVLMEAAGQTMKGLKTTTLAEALTESTNVNKKINTSCSDGMWQCMNGDCISNTMFCDGFIDCKDASDEYRKTCTISDSRPLLGLLLHCMSGSENEEEVCHPICHDAPEFCYYALVTENEKDQGCVLPEYPKNGSYEIIPYNKNENSNKNVSANNETSSTSSKTDFFLKYRCEEPFVMVENEKHECINGTWHNDNDNRYCSEACELTSYMNDNFTFTCAKDIYGNDTCKNYVAIDTIVTVRKKYEDPEYQTMIINNVSVELFCPPSKEISITTDCVDEVDKRQRAFEGPTMMKMTEYEAEFIKFKSNDTSDEFDKLVMKFSGFENEVRNDLAEMHIMAEKCDISLDLLLSHLQRKKGEQEIEN